MPGFDTIGKLAIVVVGVIAAAAIGILLFGYVPTSTVLGTLDVLLVVVVSVLGAAVASRIAESHFPGYNVAEVAVDGTITRDGGGMLPTQPNALSADDVVEQIDEADEDDAVEALLLKMNTPGGEVVPSDDIREAAMDFEGPTIAYATDLCASGGMWIASGCDELWARDASLIGSIGVIMAQVTAGDLLDELGLTYEGIKAGEYKDALTSLKDMNEDERTYLQGLADDFYEHFVDRVVEGRDLPEEEVRDTEARIYMGETAAEMGFVDEVGDRDDVEDRLEDELGEPVSVEPFEPETGLRERVGAGARSIAYAFGAGIAGSVLDDGDVPELR